MSALRAALGGLTTRGRCLLAAGVALAVCALGLGQRDLLRAAVFLVVLPLAAVSVVARTRYRLSCERSLVPARVEAGRQTEVRLSLENVSRLPSGVLLVEDTLPWTLGARPRFVLDKVEPQGRRLVTYPVGSEVRGRFTVGPLSVRLTDPFGLCELPRSFAATDQLVVTPVVSPLPGVRLGGDWAGGGDATARSVSSSGADDAATREYRHGDDLRKVHWRSTARTGELMVRREEQPFQSRATVLLDGRLDAHRGEGPGSSYEWSVNAVASIGCALLRGGFGMRMIDHAARPLTPAGIPVTEALLLDALAAVAPDRTPDLGSAIERLRRGGLDGVLVAVLGLLDLAEADQLARLRTGSGACVAVLVDADSWAPVSPRGRELAVQTLDAAEGLLRSTGWRVLRVPHGTTLASVWPLAGARGSGRQLAPAGTLDPETSA